MKGMGAMAEAKEDKQLERLYDYTKFHIAIYLSAGGGIAGLVSAAAEGASKQTYFGSLIGCRWALALSFCFMVLAGIAGAVVATSTIESTSYKDFRDEKQGAYGCTPMRGRHWVHAEHFFFWLSLLSLAVSIFTAPAVLNWL